MNYELLNDVINTMEKGSMILVVHFIEGKSLNRKGKQFKKGENLINEDFFEKFKEFDILLNKE